MAKGETGFELASVMLAVELESKEMSWVGGVTYVCLRFYSNLLFHKDHFWLLLFTGESHSFSSGGKRYFSQSKNWIRKNSSVSSLQRSAVQYRKWSSTANDPETANDPQNGPQMILDRKWSPKSTANDPVKTWGVEWILWDWLQKRTDSKEKGKEDATSQVNLYKAKKKWNKSEKD